jgi:hypothetical protein
MRRNAPHQAAPVRGTRSRPFRGESVGCEDVRPRPGLAEVVPRSLREAGIDLEGCHPTARSNDLCKDCALVAGPCAYIDHAVAAREAQLVEQARP